jgi:hypothetical protein
MIGPSSQVPSLIFRPSELQAKLVLIPRLCYFDKFSFIKRTALMVGRHYLPSSASGTGLSVAALLLGP